VDAIVQVARPVANRYARWHGPRATWPRAAVLDVAGFVWPAALNEGRGSGWLR
jgi:hypothetical protein